MARKKKVEEQPVVEEVVEKPKRVRKKKEPTGDTNVDTNGDTIVEKPKVKRTRKKKIVEEPKVEEQQLVEQPINPLVMNLTPQKEDVDSKISVQSLCINVIPEVDSEVIDGKLPDDIEDGFTFEIDDSNHDTFIEMFSEMLGNKTKPTKPVSKVSPAPIVKKTNPLSMDVSEVKKKESEKIKLNLF